MTKTTRSEWEKKYGTFNYKGVSVTKHADGTYTVLGHSCDSFGAVILAIQAACNALAESIERGRAINGAVKSMDHKKMAV